jgi:hypothetical protein
MASHSGCHAETYESAAAKFPSLPPLQYIRNISGIQRVIWCEADVPENGPPSGLGDATDGYINAHGYNAEAKLHFSYAWRQSNTIEEFSKYLSDQGMTKAEAEWLWYFIMKESQS